MSYGYKLDCNMTNYNQSFGNIIYTEIILHENEISDKNTFETLINIDQNKISNNIQISTGLNKQILSLGNGLLFINNKFQTILI